MSNTIVLVIVAIAAFFGAEAIYYLVLYGGTRRRAELHRRLRSLSTKSSANLLRERRLARIPGLSRLLAPLPLARRLEALLLQTDLTWTVASVLGMSVLLAAGLTIGLMIALPGSRVLAVIGVPIGLCVPIFLVLNARTKRSQKLSMQLPDALDMMVRSLRAGHGVGAGFKLVAQEMPAPVAVEFGRCFEEQNLGVDMRTALLNMTKRVPGNLDLKIFAVSIVIQAETGGNLVDILEQISHTIRERYKFYGKLRALTAEGRISGYILGALPFLCVLFVGLFNPGYLQPLLGDPLGRMIALGGLVMWAFGVLWMRKLAQVDY